MNKIFYIEDKNGKYVSADKTKRWTRLSGKSLSDFLKTKKGKKTYFFVGTDDNGVTIGFEIRDKKLAEELMRSNNHHNYLTRVQKEVGYTIVSYDCFETKNGISMGDEVIPNEDESIEDNVLRQIDLEILRDALGSLDEDEYALIHALFLQKNPMTTREYANKLGVHQTTIVRAKTRILKKLKLFFV